MIGDHRFRLDQATQAGRQAQAVECHRTAGLGDQFDSRFRVDEDPVKELDNMGYSWGTEGLASAIASFDRTALKLFHEGGMRFHDYQMAMGAMQPDGHTTARALFQRHRDTLTVANWLEALVL